MPTTHPTDRIIAALATGRHHADLDVEQDIPPAFRNSIRLYGIAAMQPEEARAVGLALLAAADAAEES